MKFMKYANCLSIGVVWVLLLGGTEARANKIVTFEVPVRLSELVAEVNTFNVECYFTTNDNYSQAAPGAKVTTSVQKNANGTGSFQSVVKVPVSVSDATAAVANYGACVLTLNVPGGYQCAPSTAGNTHPVCAAKAGSQYVDRVRISVPK